MRTTITWSATRTARLAALLLALAGCAAPPRQMRAGPAPGAAARVWPAAPETPRYREAGQLVGEDNFVAAGDGARAGGLRALHWLVGLGDGEREKIMLKRPQSGAADGHGRVYVSDPANRGLLVFDQVAGELLVWNQADARRSFATPVGVALGADGEILVADAALGEVFRLGRDGKPRGSFGAGRLTRPTGLARDAARGRIYVADTHAHDVKVFDDAGTLVGVLGRRGEGEGELNFPTHLAFGGDMLYVSDSINARIVKFDAAGRPAGTLGQRGPYLGNLTRPKGLALDPEGNLYVVESLHDTLLVFDRDGRFLLPLGDTGKDAARFYLPAGAWSDASGMIYVADMFNGRVVMFQFLGGK